MTLEFEIGLNVLLGLAIIVVALLVRWWWSYRTGRTLR